MKVLVLGVTGMLGQAVFRVFGRDAEHEVWGTLRSASALRHFPADCQSRLIPGIDVLDQDALTPVLARVRPGRGDQLRRADQAVGGRERPSNRAADQCDVAAPLGPAVHAGWREVDSCEHRLRFFRT